MWVPPPPPCQCPVELAALITAQVDDDLQADPGGTSTRVTRRLYTVDIRRRKQGSAEIQ